MLKALQDRTICAYVLCCSLWEEHQQFVLLLLGVGLLFSGTSGLAEAGHGAGAGYDDEKFGRVCTAILKMHETGYGSLLTSAAGIGAIVASAMGGFKMAWSLLVVSVGSYLLKEYEMLWFNECK